jgi:hypothetical protein
MMNLEIKEKLAELLRKNFSLKEEFNESLKIHFSLKSRCLYFFNFN